MSAAPRPFRVALVEDDRRYRESLTLLLGCTADFKVVGRYATPRSFLDALGPRPGPGGDPAQDAFEEAPWDLVLLDLDLPGMHGIECLRRLRTRLPQVLVVILTVFEDRAVILDAICAGADGYLLKQTPAAELMEQIRGVVAGGAPLSAGVARTVLELVRDGRGEGPESATRGGTATWGDPEEDAGSRPSSGPPRPRGAAGTAPDGPAAARIPEGKGVGAAQPGDDRRLAGQGGSPRIEAGLTPRELDVLRGLVQGKSYKAVARSLGISVDTVRTHIRAVYRKLQVHSVAEAVSRAIRDRMV